MTSEIRRVQYFYTTVKDRPGDAYMLLSRLAAEGVNLLAFTAVPVGPTHTQLALFPEDSGSMVTAAQGAGLVLDGPHDALLVQGDDELAALAGIHERLNDAKVNIYASSGVANGRGSYGYVVYVRPDDYERAASALEV